MNKKNLWTACGAGALLSLLLANLPLIGLVNCLLCAGFWGSSLFSVWVYKRMSGTVNMKEAVKLGAWTGLLAGVLGFMLSFAGLAGLQGIVNDMKFFMEPGDLPNMDEIPLWGAMLFNLAGVFIEVGLGALGGWIGGALFGVERQARKAAQADASIPQ